MDDISWFRSCSLRLGKWTPLLRRRRHQHQPKCKHDVQPLSATGNEPATHYGCRPDAESTFVLLVQLAKGMEPPPGTPQEVIALAQQMVVEFPEVIPSLIADARVTEDKYGHWLDVLNANGLKRIESSIM